MPYVERTDEEIITAICGVMEKCKPDCLIDTIDGQDYYPADIISALVRADAGVTVRIVGGMRTNALRYGEDPLSMIEGFEKTLREFGYLANQVEKLQEADENNDEGGESA